LTSAWHGLLLIDKPAGPTSHDLVSAVRRATDQRRIGHAGTLDPGASGLLPMVLGTATRLVRFLPHSPKLYSGTLRLGVTSDTDDAAGRVIQRHDGPLPDPDDVTRAAGLLLGRGRQVTPAVSARKVGGQRLYRLARRGVRVELPASEIEVFRFDLEPGEEDGLYRFRAEVSGGTYIRGLARDLGVRLGCGGRLDALRRERIGPLDLGDALALDPAEPLTAERLRDRLIPLEQMPLGPPPTELADPDDVRRFARGNPVARQTGAEPEGLCRVLGPDGRLLGVGELSEGRLHPRVVLRSPE
jgi:tRNA pseudouridine55 synthase